MLLTHERQLEAAHDGAIPAEARHHARRLDDAIRAAAEAAGDLKEFLTAPPPPKASRFATADQLVAVMAGVIVDRTTGAGSCSETDLLAAGFSAAEIAEHAPAAKIIAAARMADREMASA